MTWSEAKFASFNLAFLRRKVVESMEARKLAIISGFYGNSNMDDGKGTRAKAISQIEDQFQEAIAELYEPTEKKDETKDNPFFEAINVPGAEIDHNPYAKGRKYENQPWIPTDLDEDIDQI